MIERGCYIGLSLGLENIMCLQAICTPSLVTGTNLSLSNLCLHELM